MLKAVQIVFLLEVPLLTRCLFGQQNGTLKIIDRKKHIFKLAQGEYIAPEKIENVYLRCEAIAQVFVHGESLQVSIFQVILKMNARGGCRKGSSYLHSKLQDWNIKSFKHYPFWF